jgi:hypothetical protein
VGGSRWMVGYGYVGIATRYPIHCHQTDVVVVWRMDSPY